ncbi:MAG: transglycosylase domain-containing protein, partial [Candidatus Promineifilaceae bacterium]
MSQDEKTRRIFAQPDNTRSSQSAPPRQRRRRRRGCFGCLGPAFIVTLLIILGVAGIGAVAASTILSSNLTEELQVGIDRLAAARDAKPDFQTTQITDRNGELLWEIFGEGKRTYIPLTRIPQAVQQATITVEDDTFYVNKGFDEPSLIAAIIANYRNPGGRPIGGSTITQQLVRHIAFDYEERVAVSYRRKLKELFLSWRMTQDFEKDEILEMYLNEIYYGNLAYGIEAAAKTYFDKSAENLTLGEATLLTGIPQAPIALDPYSNLEGAKARQWFILTLMVEDGVITVDQANTAYLEPITLKEQSISLNAPHFAVYVRQQLEEKYGVDVVAGAGLRVTTSLDLRYQALAEQKAQEHVSGLTANNLNNAALIAMQPHTGEVLAMLGSVDYHNDAISGRVNVTLSQQQPGSTFKPLTFAAAMSPEADGTPARWQASDILWDVPVQYTEPTGAIYAPVNYDERFHGPIRLRSALANSYNIPSILLAQDLGVERLINFARRMGLDSLSTDLSLYGLSLTLGGGEVTPLEMATAYSVFANGGNAVPPVTILRVEDAQGNLLFEHLPPPIVPILDERVAFVISDFLDDDVARQPAMGPTNPLDLPFPAAAKTGTTNDFRDNWTIGYTPNLVVAVWTGNTDNSPMVNVSGLTGAAPLWSDFMQGVFADNALVNTLAVGGEIRPNTFTPPAGLERQTLCSLRAITPWAETCALSEQEWMLADESVEPPPVVDQTYEKIEPAVAKMLSAPLAANGNQQFCRIGEGVWPADTKPRIFLVPPRNPESLDEAYKYANAAGLAIEPASFCGTNVVVAPTPWPTNPPATVVIVAAPTATPVPAWQPTAAPAWEPTAPAWQQPTTSAPPVATGPFWQISSPTPYQKVNSAIPIMGTALFDSQT